MNTYARVLLISALIACATPTISFAETALSPLLGTNIRAMSADALAAEGRGDIQEAIDIYKKILETHPTNVCAMNSVAGLYGKLGRYDEEILWAQKALKIDDNYGPAYVNYGSALAGKGQFTEAKQAFESAIQINPKSVISFYNLGVIAGKQNDYATAVSYYKQVIALDPKSEDAYYNLGIAYMNLDKSSEAVAAFKEVLKLNPNAADARAMLKNLGKQ